jgi:hypothetical protein
MNTFYKCIIIYFPLNQNINPLFRNVFLTSVFWEQRYILELLNYDILHQYTREAATAFIYLIPSIWNHSSSCSPNLKCVMLKSIYWYNFVGSTFMTQNIWVLKNPSAKVQNSTQLAHSWSLVKALNSLSFTEICSYCTLQAWIGPFEGLAIICKMQLSLTEYRQIACD